jgi:phospholipid/cholesterol/gamma-HCH transport system ATP-binding protein
MQIFQIFLLLVFSTYAIILSSIFIRRFVRKPRPDAEEEVSEPVNFADTSGLPLIEVINAKKTFDHPVLKGITLGVQSGETLGVLGQSGTGKSVLLKLIAGFLKPDSGLILFEGVNLATMGESKLLEIRKRVSYVFQSGAFFDFLNVRENIAYPLRERGHLSEREIEERVDYLVDAVELDGMGDLRYDELGTGAKKQVAIARSIAINPDVILYDEPTTGVDPIIGKSLSRLIRKLSQQENLTSVVVTHDLKCLEIVSDRIVLLKDGLIRFEGTVMDFRESPDSFVDAFRTGKRFDEEPGEILAM